MKKIHFDMLTRITMRRWKRKPQIENHLFGFDFLGTFVLLRRGCPLYARHWTWQFCCNAWERLWDLVHQAGSAQHPRHRKFWCGSDGWRRGSVSGNAFVQITCKKIAMVKTRSKQSYYFSHKEGRIFQTYPVMSLRNYSGTAQCSPHLIHWSRKSSLV